jgi:hypothetical protein
MRWNREHREKIPHRFRLGAVLHAWRINTFRDDGKPKRKPYPCRWGPDYHTGENAKLHWHVGRPTTNHQRGYDGPWDGYTPEQMERLLTGEERRNLKKPTP